MNDKPNSLIDAKRTLHGVLESEKVKEQIARVLPRHITADRLIRVALTAANKSPNLLLCSPESVIQAILVCAQAGLEPDGRLAHLIPFETKAGWRVQVIFDYKGLISLALRNGGLDAVYADKVCENDLFSARVVNGVKQLSHEIDWKKPRGKTYAYYAVSSKGSVVDFEVMSLEEIEAIRARSKAKDKGPWVSDFDEMGKKCPIRRMSKRWDLLPEIRDAIYADDDTPEPIEVQAHSRPIFSSPKQVEPGDMSREQRGKLMDEIITPESAGKAEQYIPAEGEFTAEEAERLVSEEMGKVEKGGGK